MHDEAHGRHSLSHDCDRNLYMKHDVIIGSIVVPSSRSHASSRSGRVDALEASADALPIVKGAKDSISSVNSASGNAVSKGGGRLTRTSDSGCRVGDCYMRSCVYDRTNMPT